MILILIGLNYTDYKLQHMLDLFYFYITDNPQEFLVGFLEKLQSFRTSRMEYPCIFEDQNIQSIFGMLDPTGRGFISLEQYKAGG